MVSPELQGVACDQVHPFHHGFTSDGLRGEDTEQGTRRHALRGPLCKNAVALLLLRDLWPPPFFAWGKDIPEYKAFSAASVHLLHHRFCTNALRDPPVDRQDASNNALGVVDIKDIGPPVFSRGCGRGLSYKASHVIRSIPFTMGSHQTLSGNSC